MKPPNKQREEARARLDKLTDLNPLRSTPAQDAEAADLSLFLARVALSVAACKLADAKEEMAAATEHYAYCRNHCRMTHDNFDIV